MSSTRGGSTSGSHLYWTRSRSEKPLCCVKYVSSIS
jgi:hypothetical protein